MVGVIVVRSRMKNILVVDQLKKIYPPSAKGESEFCAVDTISFTVKKGEIVGLLGPNGAGKSTTIQMLIDTLKPTSGTVEYFGKDLHRHRSEVLQHVTFASTYIKMPWRLTVMENLWIYALLYGLNREQFNHRVENFLNYFGVWDQRHKTIGMLSAGQITRIMLAKAFIPYPKVVLLDEPTASLDPDMAHQVRDFVKKQQKEYGMSIVYTSHNMDEVATVCDRVIFLNHGKIVAQDTPDNLAKSVSLARVRLWVKDGLKRTARYASEQGLTSHIEDREIVIEIDEPAIAGFLDSLADAQIEYSQISIDKPTLEDYFLSMSKQANLK